MSARKRKAPTRAALGTPAQSPALSEGGAVSDSEDDLPVFSPEGGSVFESSSPGTPSRLGAANL
jgi:hypothetical protein